MQAALVLEAFSLPRTHFIKTLASTTRFLITQKQSLPHSLFEAPHEHQVSVHCNLSKQSITIQEGVQDLPTLCADQHHRERHTKSSDSSKQQRWFGCIHIIISALPQQAVKG